MPNNTPDAAVGAQRILTIAKGQLMKAAKTNTRWHVNNGFWSLLVRPGIIVGLVVFLFVLLAAIFLPCFLKMRDPVYRRALEIIRQEKMQAAQANPSAS